MPDGISTEEQEMKDLISFYNKQGYSQAQIMTLLKNKGYDDEVVEQFFAKPKREFKATPILGGKRKLDLKSMILYLLAIGVLGAAIYIIWTVFFGGGGLESYIQEALA